MCIKYLIVFYHFFSWLVAVIILGLLSSQSLDSKNYLGQNEIGHYYMTPFTWLLVLSGAMTVVGFIGIYAALKDSLCLVGIYLLLCVTMVVCYGTSLLWAIHNQSTMTNIKYDLAKLLQLDYGRDSSNATTLLVDRIQHDFKCCGANAAEDWINSRFNGCNNTVMETGIVAPSTTTCSSIPISCCVHLRSGDCWTTICKSHGVYDFQLLKWQGVIFEGGCADKLDKFIKDKWQWIVITNAVLLVVQVLELILGLVLSCAM